ncbi:DUF4326 domain-containing protein [Devosia sp. PTR5]|uniref:DUF4326 domain-containing protein n=1 Tax=Devosia oryzisoli TaxID=2774138 RepID=A0A927IRH4_9HYPH|nr:DUF4326 domain-containing protein [Devosia oryzisoli]MBD8066705.1 DUF4326 domain-containing protein [Devosia oryzisoli]
MKPVRLVLSRRSGFDLQALSQTTNGLQAQSVARPGRWGNPFSVGAIAEEMGIPADAARAEAVRRHRLWLAGQLEIDRPPPDPATIRAELGGKNLACWCSSDGPCHADTLISVANP